MRLTARTKKFWILGAFILMIASVSYFATQNLMTSNDPKVYFLYTSREKIPAAAFKISSIPLAVASYLRYGDRAFVIEPITTDAVKEAFTHGQFLIIGTHGRDGSFMTDNHVMIGPEGTQNPSMKLVFFGSCDVGQRKQEWQSRFPNALIKSYDRPMYAIEGWLYLVFGSWIDLIREN